MTDKQKLGGIFAAGLMVLLLGGSPAFAQKIDYGIAPSTLADGGGAKTADQTCDPAYWKSLTARAWMEAEREIIQNKNLIYKPDSVMEYVCFDSFMQHAAMTIGPIFTHTTYYNGKEIIPSTNTNPLSTAQALKKVVTDAYKPYVAANFSHKFLGARAEHLDSTSADRTIGDASQMATYACHVMNNIWKAAKCENFIDNEKFNLDGFFPFEKLTGGGHSIDGYKEMAEKDIDPRKFPTACKPPQNSPATWAAAIPDASNKETKTTYDKDKLYKFKEPNKKTYEDIRPRLEPAKCGSESPPIFTGVTVISKAGETGYKDGICSNPGCSYNKGGTCE